MGNRKIILWEYQKKRVCEFYGCSDSDDKQYPECTSMQPNRCSLHEIQGLIFELNQPCEHPRILDIYEEGKVKRVGTICADRGKQQEG